MTKLFIYRIKEDYIKYLHGIDHRVQYNKSSRPYVGVVLSIDGNDYFVPMESPKPNHAKLKNNFTIYKLDGGKYGLLGFNNMIPAAPHHLIKYDITAEPDLQYRNLLLNQARICRRNASDIMLRAKQTYEAVTVKKTPFFVKICCDFKLLEGRYKEFV